MIHNIATITGNADLAFHSEEIINNVMSMVLPFIAFASLIIVFRIIVAALKRVRYEGGYFPSTSEYYNEQDKEDDLDTIFDDCKVIETERSIGIFKKDSWTCPYCDRENKEEDYDCNYCAAPKMRSMYQTKK